MIFSVVFFPVVIVTSTVTLSHHGIPGSHRTHTPLRTTIGREGGVLDVAHRSPTAGAAGAEASSVRRHRRAVLVGRFLYNVNPPHAVFLASPQIPPLALVLHPWASGVGCCRPVAIFSASEGGQMRWVLASTGGSPAVRPQTIMPAFCVASLLRRLLSTVGPPRAARASGTTHRWLHRKRHTNQLDPTHPPPPPPDARGPLWGWGLPVSVDFLGAPKAPAKPSFARGPTKYQP